MQARLVVMWAASHRASVRAHSSGDVVSSLWHHHHYHRSSRACVALVATEASCRRNWKLLSVIRTGAADVCSLDTVGHSERRIKLLQCITIDVLKRLAARFNLLPHVTKLQIWHSRIPLDAYINEQIFVKKGVFFQLLKRAQTFIGYNCCPWKIIDRPPSLFNKIFAVIGLSGQYDHCSVEVTLKSMNYHRREPL